MPWSRCEASCWERGPCNAENIDRGSWAHYIKDEASMGYFLIGFLGFTRVMHGRCLLVTNFLLEMVRSCESLHKTQHERIWFYKHALMAALGRCSSCSLCLLCDVQDRGWNDGGAAEIHLLLNPGSASVCGLAQGVYLLSGSVSLIHKMGALIAASLGHDSPCRGLSSIWWAVGTPHMAAAVTACAPEAPRGLLLSCHFPVRPQSHNMRFYPTRAQGMGGGSYTALLPTL